MEVINPENESQWLELRTKDITSTEVSALFGISPYMTPFELWHRKKDGVVVRLDENERMKWGIALQDAIASQIAKEQGWEVRRMNEYIRLPDIRVGSSFDFYIHSVGLLEIKNVDGLVFKNEWTEDENGNIQAPLHIEIQVQHQLLVSGRDLCYIGALVGGNKQVLIKRTRDEAVIQAIKEKVAEFWARIDQNIPPPADFEADAEFLGKLFGYAEPGKVLNVVEDNNILHLASEYQLLKESIKISQGRCDAIKAELLSKIGDAEKVIGEGFSIDCGITGASHVEYDREAYRRFMIRFKKVKP